MKKLLVLLLTMHVSIVCFSTDFLARDYYFDNGKMKFPVVKMIVGDTATCRTHVLDMTAVEGRQWWKHSFSEPMTVDYYAFINLDLEAGVYYQAPQQFVDSLHNAVGEAFKHTVLEETYKWGYVYVNWVYCPDFSLNNSDGYWRPQSSYDVATPSGSVPVLHICTQDSMEIVTKEYYIPATLWLDNCGIEGYESLGSEENPLEIEIKGRGNWTWLTKHKKPYKIKFADKVAPLGLDRSRHFMIKPDVEDRSGYLRNETGFELSRVLEMPYTPRQLPVEVFLNGEYIGMYFLCEKIRVEGGRVDVVEQNDQETDPYNITGGWLLESRGNKNPAAQQYENNDPGRMWYAFESQSPEHLSPQQRAYISTFIAKTDSCIFVADKDDCGWEQRIDINSLARFYVIQEVMDNVESFDGSLYLFKDLGFDEKLNFGPVWDFDNSHYTTTGDRFVYKYTLFPFLWIEEISKFPRFQQQVRSVWKEFLQKDALGQLKRHAQQWRSLIEQAEQQDLKRWPTYASAHPATSPDNFLNCIARKVAWLNTQWGELGDVNLDSYVNAADVTAIYSYILRGDTTHVATCDVNGDGNINAADVTALYKIIINH